MFRTVLWVSLVVVFVVYGLYAMATLDRRDDETRLRSLVADTTAAIGERDLSGTVACLSKDYSDETGLKYDRLRVVIAQSLRIDTPFTARSEIKKLEVDGDDATMEVRGIVRAIGGSDLYAHDLTLHLKKEPARHMGLIPTRVWRVVRVDNLALPNDASF